MCHIENYLMKYVSNCVNILNGLLWSSWLKTFYCCDVMPIYFKYICMCINLIFYIVFVCILIDCVSIHFTIAHL